MKSLNINPANLKLGDTTNLSSHVEIAIKKFENHPRFPIITTFNSGEPAKIGNGKKYKSKIQMTRAISKNVEKQNFQDLCKVYN